MNKKVVTAILSALLCSATQAATIFSPTDTTVNFVEIFGDSSAKLGIFDDSDPGFTGSYLALQASGDQAIFTPSGANYSLTNKSGLGPNTFTLSGSDNFTLAAWSPTLNAWQSPDSVFCTALSGSCSLSWSGIAVELAVDLTPAPPTSGVPLPSPALLLGFGVFGLVTVGRRRT